MKIAFLSVFYPYRGGIAQFNACLYRALEEGNEVMAFNFSRQYPNFLFPGKSQFVNKGDKADSIESFRLLDSVNPFSFYKTAKAINDYNPDLLIIPFWMSFFGPSLGKVAKLINPSIKKLCIAHNIIPHERKAIDEPFTKYFINKMDGFVVLSNSVELDLKNWCTTEPKVLSTQHPYYSHFGTKLNKSKAQTLLKLQPDKKTLLFFGFIREYKGLDILLEAFNDLSSEYQLVIAGECYGSFDAYQKQIDENKNKEGIYLFDQYISDEEVPLYFSAADVCVLPYKTATQSGISSISHHFDLPIIATDTGGLKETIGHKKDGLIVSEPSSKLFKESIEYYFNNDCLEPYSQAIQQLKKERSWEAFASQIKLFSKSL